MRHIFQAKLDSVKNKLVKRKAEKELMDIRTKVKKTDAVEEFIKKEQSKAENEEDFEGDYECPILKDKVRSSYNMMSICLGEEKDGDSERA